MILRKTRDPPQIPALLFRNGPFKWQLSKAGHFSLFLQHLSTMDAQLALDYLRSTQIQRINTIINLNVPML